MGRRDRDPALCPVVARRARQERSLHAAGAGAAGGCAPRFHHARSPEDRVRRHRAPRDGAAQRDRAADRGVPGLTGGAKAPGAQPAAIGARGGERGRLELKALLLEGTRRPLRTAEIPRPEPGPGQILLAVRACGVCRTDLHVLDGELPDPKLPLVPGHEIVGTVAGVGPGSARFTGYQLDGGYAEYAVADERFCFPLPDAYRDVEAAPLLCAGLIGYRSLVAAGTRRGSGCTASARRRISWRRWRGPRGGASSPSHARAISRRSSSPARSAPNGPGRRTPCPRSRWTPRSSSPRRVPWSPWPSAPWRKAAPWCAPGSI